MALIAMAVYCTEENKKDMFLEEILLNLSYTASAHDHDVYLCVNGATPYAKQLIESFTGCIKIKAIWNETNLGTAKAINKAWSLRKSGQHCVKMDDDIQLHERGWVEEMERAIARDTNIGQIGLKRKDCWETPWHENPDFRSELKMLPHQPGEPWIIVEKAKHIIGSCVMHSSALIDKVGGLYQPSLYGYDDVIMSHRTHLAGFYSCFLPHINIDHIDPGDTPYQDWKQKHSGEQTDTVIQYVREMYNGTKPIYHAL